MSLTVGVDIGGTKVLGGVVDGSGTVLASCRRDSPAGNAAALLDTIIEVVSELAAAYDVQAVGVGAAGLVDAARSTVLFAANVAWRDEPLRRTLEEALALPVVIENDANAAAWAEFRHGAARDAEDSAVMLTVGTGIGGGIILRGQLFRGAGGLAGEPGHMVAVRGGLLCGCGRRGCLDRYASGGALVRFAREGAAVRQSALSGAQVLSGRIVAEAARAGDAVAVAAFADVAHWLAQGVADIVQLLDPQVVVIGGGVAESGELLMAPLRTAYGEALRSRAMFAATELRLAALGCEAGLVGAADLAHLN
ncbi:ROK family protein [Longispora sp. NPDC051575]|uniref:ROK family protein n=1 Tax=Longispora sp. NPDC051575 TaxID=3154943 RepID=UPI0034158A89